MQPPLIKNLPAAVPSSLTSTLSGKRGASLEEPEDPLLFESLTNQQTIESGTTTDGCLRIVGDLWKQVTGKE
jgi:hypothetical protein